MPLCIFPFFLRGFLLLCLLGFYLLFWRLLKCLFLYEAAYEGSLQPFLLASVVAISSHTGITGCPISLHKGP